MEKIGALWKKESKNIGTFLSGDVRGEKIFIMKNKYKKKDLQPDYIIFLQELEKEKSESHSSTPSNFDDDMPF